MSRSIPEPIYSIQGKMTEHWRIVWTVGKIIDCIPHAAFEMSHAIFIKKHAINRMKKHLDWTYL